MTLLYKLTDENGQTYNKTQWAEGTTHTTNGEGDLCGPGWIHAYTDPLLAVLLNPLHANFRSPIMWEAEGEIGKTDNGLKVGTTKLTTLRKIPLPEITREQRITFAILCVKEVCSNQNWNKWADCWLNGTDRTEKAAAAWAAAAAEAAAEARAAAAEAAARAAVAVAGMAAKQPSDLASIARKAVSQETGRNHRSDLPEPLT